MLLLVLLVLVELLVMISNNNKKHSSTDDDDDEAAFSLETQLCFLLLLHLLLRRDSAQLGGDGHVELDYVELDVLSSARSLSCSPSSIIIKNTGLHWHLRHCFSPVVIASLHTVNTTLVH